MEIKIGNGPSKEGAFETLFRKKNDNKLGK